MTIWYILQDMGIVFIQLLLEFFHILSVYELKNL